MRDGHDMFDGIAPVHSWNHASVACYPPPLHITKILLQKILYRKSACQNAINYLCALAETMPPQIDIITLEADSN